jgi:hypothetical protein
VKLAGGVFDGKGAFVEAKRPGFGLVGSLAVLTVACLTEAGMAIEDDCRYGAGCPGTG